MGNTTTLTHTDQLIIGEMDISPIGMTNIQSFIIMIAGFTKGVGTTMWGKFISMTVALLTIVSPSD
jgi:hypothetical protein